jgi:hypothetical protein
LTKPVVHYTGGPPYPGHDPDDRGSRHGHTGQNTLRGPQEVEDEDDEDAEDEEEARLRLGTRSPWRLSCAPRTRMPDLPQEGGLMIPRSYGRTTRAGWAPMRLATSEET